jgi:hypothetical protein
MVVQCSRCKSSRPRKRSGRIFSLATANFEPSFAQVIVDPAALGTTFCPVHSFGSTSGQPPTLLSTSHSSLEASIVQLALHLPDVYLQQIDQEVLESQWMLLDWDLWRIARAEEFGQGRRVSIERCCLCGGWRRRKPCKESLPWLRLNRNESRRWS